MSKTYVKSSCHCGLNAFIVAFLTSTLPQATDMCHCSSCRHTSGKLAQNGAIIDGVPLSIDSGADGAYQRADTSTLATYNVTPHLNRHFCPGCGAVMFVVLVTGPRPVWIVSTGTLERTAGIAKVGYHAFVKDTRDGGLADHFRAMEGVKLPRYDGYEGAESVPIGFKVEKAEKKRTVTQGEGRTLAQDEGRLEAYCHCKTVQVHLTRATPAQAADTTQWWLVPDSTSGKAPTTTRVRFAAAHDMCTSCRRTGGCTVASWATIPRANIVDNHTSLPVAFLEGGKAAERRRMPGLTQYQSSPGTFREFCSTCGANAFVWSRKNKSGRVVQNTGEEPTVVNIGVGLFDEEEDGARAENWLCWSPSIVNSADALDICGRDAVQATLDQVVRA